jgi:hypothetical protein
MACNFYLLTLLAYMKHTIWRRNDDLRHWLALGVTIVLAVAAVLCKETAVTALVVCGIYDVIKGYTGCRDKVNFCFFFFYCAILFFCLRIQTGKVLHYRQY